MESEPPTRKDEEGHPLTVAGLAHTAFPQRTCCRGHVVIATAKLGAPAIIGLTLLGLVRVGLGYLGRKVGAGLALGGTPGCLWGRAGRGEPAVHNPSPGAGGIRSQENVGGNPHPQTISAALCP